MRWEVHVPRRVVRTLLRFPARDIRRLQEILGEFARDPWNGDVVKIKGESNLWRRRVGNYRIFYSPEISTRKVEIKEIERRTSTTY